ncbi:MAG: aminopeptidase [Brevinema sp.]
MAEKNKSPYQYSPKNIWEISDKEQRKEIFDLAKEYTDFSNNARTERQCANLCLKQAENQGFKPLSSFKNVKPGDKIYYAYQEKNLLLAIIGDEPLSQGVNIVGAHMDAPRLDLKIHPLIEDTGIALLKTHYYGGIKKYQWLNIPLEINGVVVKGDGSTVEVSIGSDPADPIFVISDLLPHLSRKIQGEKKLLDGIDGENLNLLAGTIPVDNKDFSERAKAHVLEILHEKYGIIEEDLISAELEVTPAMPTRCAGLDRSMIAGYAHDDRVCVFASVKALFDIKTTPKRTSIAFLTDKEEIGSVGISGATGPALLLFIGELLNLQSGNYTDLALRRALAASFCISADVGALYNPMYAAVHDKYNASFINNGIILKKYTGAGGKSGGSDASAELLGKMRRIFNENNVVWQSSSMGKIDEGGGGTIAMFIARHGIPVIDSGIGVMGMHAPYEIISKADLAHMVKAYHAFYLNA